MVIFEEYFEWSGHRRLRKPEEKNEAEVGVTELILASQSPRRRQLLQDAGYEFEIRVPSDDAETEPHCGELPRDLVARQGRQKAENVAKTVSHGIVIGCDTVADCDSQVLGKPKDRAHAEQMLRQLQGREHFVHSGLCLWQCPGDDVFLATETTKLFMRELTDVELEEYLDSELWVGKAGAFGYQDRTGWLKIVEGSESNVVGLPMELLTKALAGMMERE